MRPEDGGDPAAFRDQSGVSRETLVRLEIHAALLRKWQARVNLVSRSTLEVLWRRHMLDSWQVLHFARRIHGERMPRRWLDIGSGAGFPGLVLAICGAGHVDLVESDRRKCAFLGQVIRETGADATVHPGRIESVTPFDVEAVTARACAPLDRLAVYAGPFLGPDSGLWALKGRGVDKELDALAGKWRYNLERFTSLSDAGGTVLRLTQLRQRDV